MDKTATTWSFNRGLPLGNATTGLRSARNLTFWLDDQFRIPGTRWRFGWDTIIGVVPVLGDATTTVLALIPVAAAWKVGASRWVLAKMLTNVAIDATIGVVPLVGDALDVFFRANRRNRRLLVQHLDQQRLANQTVREA